MPAAGGPVPANRLDEPDLLGAGRHRQLPRSGVWPDLAGAVGTPRDVADVQALPAVHGRRGVLLAVPLLRSRPGQRRRHPEGPGGGGGARGLRHRRGGGRRAGALGRPLGLTGRAGCLLPGPALASEIGGAPGGAPRGAEADGREGNLAPGAHPRGGRCCGCGCRGLRPGGMAQCCGRRHRRRVAAGAAEGGSRAPAVRRAPIGACVHACMHACPL
mmetsp:Transcript_92333/g.287805  ORF Transcript_92333/g.287805 Transcript_92333/m.287805 type:complete len:216 (-) Transcript_92333:14-661(-)